MVNKVAAACPQIQVEPRSPSQLVALVESPSLSVGDTPPGETRTRDRPVVTLATRRNGLGMVDNGPTAFDPGPRRPSDMATVLELPSVRSAKRDCEANQKTPSETKAGS